MLIEKLELITELGFPFDPMGGDGTNAIEGKFSEAGVIYNMQNKDMSNEE